MTGSGCSATSGATGSGATGLLVTRSKVSAVTGAASRSAPTSDRRRRVSSAWACLRACSASLRATSRSNNTKAPSIRPGGMMTHQAAIPSTAIASAPTVRNTSVPSMRRRALRMLARRSAASSSVQVISSSTVNSRSVTAR